MHNAPLRMAIRTTLVYVVFATAWILGGDHLLLQLTHDPERLTYLQSVKGLFFILASAGLILFLQRRDLGRIDHSARELVTAYERTIEGWSRALDLRDKETEGHSSRVTAHTLRLAAALGIGEEELLHVRRGALLHDIGKMGIPDRILLKPGPLTEQEWEIMRRHPDFAKELLEPIVHLRPALDIPYCHHEKWDGSGYPRGLKGEGIPLAARVFAVVDVWDALTSDRSYRPAWSPERALEQIRNDAGRHFDPQVVTAFLALGFQNAPPGPGAEAATGGDGRS